MGKLDTTRHLFVPSKHYVGARMQQGRSVVDADWNEDAMLEAEDLRQTLVELIGGQGSFNAGFAVGEVEPFVQEQLASDQPVTTYDFSLWSGSLYASGLRVQADAGGGERFLSQIDWLQVATDGSALPSQPGPLDLLGPPNFDGIYFYNEDLVTTQRHDLVYLEAWEQPVTAVEDSELRERALGGPDTGARIRRMRRIHVLPDVGSDEPQSIFQAFGSQILVATIDGQVTSVGTFTNDQEFVSAARVTVTPVTESGDQPCGPKPPAGYIGHEDRAIRVELRGPTSIVWGFGNSAPLYRARIGAGRLITLLSRPRDPHLYPRAGQIIELCAWGSKLPNDEKAAELTGHMLRVTKSYDPATGQLEVAESPGIPYSLVAWHTSHTEHWSERDSEPNYVYLRLWDRGSDIESDTIIDTADGIVPIGHTGLELRMSGAGKSGDYWILAARRPTPELVLPWQLLSSAAPHGPRRFYAALALVSWSAPLQFLDHQQRGALQPGSYAVIAADEPVTPITYGPVQATVTDMRRQLTPLCIRGCATITVGDGDLSHGMANSLQEAIDRLPAEGGEIRLLRGLHEVEDVVLDGRSNIKISGCGLKCRLTPTTPQAAVVGDIYNQGNPLLTLQGCTNIVLEGFVVDGQSAVGIKLVGATSTNVRVSRVRFEMSGAHTPGPSTTYALAQAGVLALGGDTLTIEHCRFVYTNVLNYTPAVVVGATNLRVHGNQVLGGNESMGGIQILSYSQDVEVTNNDIREGWGPGIALGHVLDSDDLPATLDPSTSWTKLERMLGDVLSNLHDYSPSASESARPDAVGDWTPGGPVLDLCIRDNRILDKGHSGITTAAFLETDMSGPGARFIVAVNLDIQRNEILRNMQITTLNIPRMFNCDTAVGGVCIAAGINLQVRGNVIRNNGADHLTPIVGVGVVSAQGLSVLDNVIVDNGRPHPVPNQLETTIGLRGGVAICEVVGIRGYKFSDAVPGITVEIPEFDVPRSDVALTVRKNEISEHIGKALWVLAGFGPIIVTENSLHGRGDPIDGGGAPSSLLGAAKGGTSYTLQAQGATVDIRNLAISTALGYAGDVPAVMFADTDHPIIEVGPIEFHANEVSLEWSWLRGYASSVLLSSLDSVTVTDNSMSVSMGNVFTTEGTGEPIDHLFLTDLLVTPEDHSFVLVHCWAGAPSTVQVTGNRFEEGRWDCAFSCLAAHAAAFGNEAVDISRTATTHASLLAMNIGTHCFIGGDGPGPTTKSNNTTIRETVTDCLYTGQLSAPGSQLVSIEA